MSEVVGQLHIKQELQDCAFSGAASVATTTTTSSSTSNMQTSNKNNSGSTSGSSSTITRSYSNSNSNSNSCHKCSPSASPERPLQSAATTTTTNTATIAATTTTTSSSNSNSTNTTSNTIRDELRRLCLVCGDVASGFHYGVASCEACKAFFKRTIQGNIEYTCPANNECEINKRRRKACQACRFQKCLLMGMLKEGVRLDRVRGGRQKYRRNPVSNSYQTMQLLYQSSATTLDDIKILEILNNFEPELFNAHAAAAALTLQKREDNALSNGTSEDSTNVKFECNSNSNQSSSSSSTGSIASSSTAGKQLTKQNKRDKLLTHALNALQQSNNNNKNKNNNNNNNLINNNNNITKSNNNNNNYEREDILNMLSDIYDKELLSVIGWAKQIPGFPELPLNDQMKLLQISWAEILTLQLAFRSLPFNGRLCFANDLWMDELLAKECGYLEFYYHCVQIAQRLERVQLRREEYFLLKALLLSNCDILLDDQSSLRAFRNTILNSLNDVVYLLRRSSAVAHQQQLLLLLPSLRQADGILRRIWRQIQLDGIVNLKMLFVEMLEPPLLR